MRPTQLRRRGWRQRHVSDWVGSCGRDVHRHLYCIPPLNVPNLTDGVTMGVGRVPLARPASYPHCHTICEIRDAERCNARIDVDARLDHTSPPSRRRDAGRHPRLRSCVGRSGGDPLRWRRASPHSTGLPADGRCRPRDPAARPTSITRPRCRKLVDPDQSTGVAARSEDWQGRRPDSTTRCRREQRGSCRAVGDLGGPASNHTVVRIDPRTDSVVKTFRLDFYPVVDFASRP